MNFNYSEAPGWWFLINSILLVAHANLLLLHKPAFKYFTEIHPPLRQWSVSALVIAAASFFMSLGEIGWCRQNVRGIKKI
ncbi:MAG TPA: hypothetical protein DIT95_06895 [Arenibacter sp.]|nr:hypothetical protein [Arenibacter sp.]